MEVGASVKLISYNGTVTPEADVDPAENYWQLIGETGKVVKNVPANGVASDRVLVHFTNSVNALGLHCHNEIINSLWIQKGDLETHD